MTRIAQADMLEWAMGRETFGFAEFRDDFLRAKLGGPEAYRSGKSFLDSNRAHRRRRYGYENQKAYTHTECVEAGFRIRAHVALNRMVANGNMVRTPDEKGLPSDQYRWSITDAGREVVNKRRLVSN